MSIVEWGTNLILEIIRISGYPGIFFLMALESACMPIPSEIVMPFAGYLVQEGKLGSGFSGLMYVTLAGTFGCTAGSVAAYYVGIYLGRPFILKYGRYVLLREKHLQMAESWFDRYGDIAVFFSRVLPVIRTFISLPAGIGKMNFKKFVVYTTVGSFPWCFALAYIGYAFDWRFLHNIAPMLDMVVVSALLIIVAYYIYRYKKNQREGSN